MVLFTCSSKIIFLSTLILAIFLKRGSEELSLKEYLPRKNAVAKILFLKLHFTHFDHEYYSWWNEDSD